MAVVPIISQNWDTTSYVNPTRMNNIETNISTLSKATGIEYSSGVSVKDKIDSMVFPKKVYSALNSNAKSVTIEDGNTYLLTITGGGGGVNSSVAIVNKRYDSNPVVLQWILNGVGANETTVSGNTVTCSLTGYNYQMTLTQLS